MKAVELLEQRIAALTIMRGMCRKKIEELPGHPRIDKLHKRIIEIEHELWDLEGERLILSAFPEPPRD